jgi:ATP-binding cassette subfamily C protein
MFDITKPFFIKDSYIDVYFSKAGVEGAREFFFFKIEEGIWLPLPAFEGFVITVKVRKEKEIAECSEIPLELFQDWMSKVAAALSESSETKASEAFAISKQKSWKEGYEYFLAQITPQLLTMMQKTLFVDETIIQEREREADQGFKSSLLDMENVLSRVSDLEKKPSKDPLLYALEKIAEDRHFSFTFPNRFPDGMSDLEKLDQIAELSQIAYRKVRLRGRFWKTDTGVLLAFSEGKPVALITGKFFLKYMQVGIGEKKKIDEKLAAKLNPIAYMFYTPFPSDVKKGSQVLHFLWKHTASNWKRLLVFSILSMGASLFPSAATYLLFRYAISQSSYALISYISIGLLVSTFGISLFYFLRNYCLLRIEGIGSHLLQCALWDRVLKLRPSFFRKYSVGNLYSRIMSLEEIQIFINNSNLVSILNGVFSLFYLVVMFFFSPLLALITLISSLFVLCLIFFYSYRLIRSLTRFTGLQGTLRGLNLQMILGVSKLRTSGSERSAFANWAKTFAKAKVWQMKAQSMQNRIATTAALFPILTYWAIYMAMVYWIGIQALALPDFLAFNMALGSFILAFYPMGMALGDMARAWPTWKRASVLLEEPLEESEQKAMLGKLRGHIRIDRVTFAYDKDSPLVLREISMEIHPEEYVAIVGKSGSGKSTIARLLLGFEKPLTGSIYYEGKDFSHLDPRSVRRQIGSVLQGDQVGGGTLYENLVCGGRYTKEQILNALKISGFAQDLASFPMKLNTFIPSGGETLSGGQKQRLLLARAFLANPSVLILDEATSALDNQTQETVSDYIDKLKVTRIVIAQRLSTIRKAHRIYVIDEGQISASGKFEELIEKCPLFADMVVRQKL